MATLWSFLAFCTDPVMVDTGPDTLGIPDRLAALVSGDVVPAVVVVPTIHAVGNGMGNG